MADVFGRRMVSPQKPITADMCQIIWPGGTDGDIITAATNVNIVYQQAVTRRRTLGSAGGAPIAVLYPSQPAGSLTMQRLVSEKRQQLFNRDGWNICRPPATLTINFVSNANYADCTVTGDSYILTGAMVSSYSLAAEAESLTVVDNVSVDFLQMEYVYGG